MWARTIYFPVYYSYTMSLYSASIYSVSAICGPIVYIAKARRAIGTGIALSLHIYIKQANSTYYIYDRYRNKA